MIVKLTHARLYELLSYDEKSGVFTRRIALSNRSRAGETVGSESNGYLWVCVDGARYSCHRLVWLYVYGRWPRGKLDHINGQRSDNRLRNLRECTDSENSQNIHGARAHNSHGLVGVDLHKASGLWRARIAIEGKRCSLGYFKTASDAQAAYFAAKARTHLFWNGDGDFVDRIAAQAGVYVPRAAA